MKSSKLRIEEITDLNDLLDYSQLKKEEVRKAVTEGVPVYMAGKRYFIDEAIS